MDEVHSKYSETEEIKIISSHKNNTDFSKYFKVLESRKKFRHEKGEDFFLDTRKTLINNTEYTHFESSSKLDYKLASCILCTGKFISLAA